MNLHPFLAEGSIHESFLGHPPPQALLQQMSLICVGLVASGLLLSDQFSSASFIA